MAIDRSVSVSAHTTLRGENVWAILCRSALTGIEWAAGACGAKDTRGDVERAELLLEHGSLEPGSGPLLPPSGAPFGGGPCLDWAGLNELDRAQLAIALGFHTGTPPRPPQR